MINTQLDTTLERYQAAIKSLDSSNIEVEQILGVFHARDAVQLALKEPKHIPSSSLNKLILSDAELRKKAEAITKVIQAETWENWRESIHPAAEAWWWRLESIAPHPWDNWDWLWKILSLASWATNISFLVNIATRFLSGGGVGFIGVAAVAVPSILTLLQASSETTKFGEEGFTKLFDKKIPILGKKIPKQYHQETKLGLNLLTSGFLISFWFCLPEISHLYNRNGLDNFDKGNFGSAEQDYQRAISLNADNTDAHYNLGNLYEEWQQIDKAKQEYQIAIGGDSAEPYNNLGRLYIKDKKYPEAAALLTQGLNFTKNPDFKKPEIKYSLFKNLGWVRLQQARYDEAILHLKTAIDISEKPENSKYIPNSGVAHCLMAQVLEKQKAPSTQALSSWKKCVDLGSITNPDEDGWLYLAHQKLHKK
ncbi:tetratricopeptide repeat protein [Rivularia sp. UHCC 0363]|uniref:tetratricopeptide repeat protein n=1 Tax=Rivularia sp. UHCC 0363 TaxID=3110244 RepID=UPI002B213720|nr:tetratricopeptide repeat protein [Rivularia sp. UHCC 0363]MEA5594724.1 tetratricopeptide repeat protein [Rivularia sp. UHCC 0363]